VVGDWIETVTVLGASGDVDASRVGYRGLSIGTRFGLPVAAELGPRLRCAIFGKFGLGQAPSMHPGLTANERMLTAARRITAPILFHAQWHDEIFPRDGQFELFDAFSSAHKRLLAYPGPHASTHPDQEAAWREFITTHLRAPEVN
jgi:dienelactone hydrolase